MKLNKKLNILAIMIFLIAAALIPTISFSVAQEEQIPQENSEDKISLDLKNVDIVELLRIVSLKTGRTIVPSKDVAGRITVYLSNVAFNDVLDIILLTQGLALNKKDNVYYVMSEAEYKKMYGKDYVDQRQIETVKLSYAKPSVVFNALGQLKSDVGKIVVDETTGTIILIDIPEKLELLKKTITELDKPLITTIFDLNYIKAADAKAQLNAAVTQGTGGVIIDERSGKAIISDLPGKMKSLGMLVREIDEESRQVYLEADIVELTLSDKFERGIDWEKVFNEAAMQGLNLAGYFPASSLSALGATAFQRITIGSLTSDQYDIVLNFLDTYGKTHVISQPRIAVVNNEEANIMVGVREAYITGSQSQATSTTVTSETVEFVDVGVKLKIVPRIGADGFITMKIKPEVSSVKSYLSTEISYVPIVQTSQSETVVKVKDGMMIMIAGMTKTEDIDSIKGWPVLSKIPYVGALFSYRSHEIKRTEVIIFLTPHLMRGDMGLRGEEITDILPMEYLPEDLQNKVVRDKVIDRNINAPEKLKEEQDAKLAIETAVEEAADRAAKASLKKQADKKSEKATKKAADEAKKKAKAAEQAAKAQDQAKEKTKVAADQVKKQAVEQAIAADKNKPLQKETAKDYYQKGLHAQADSNIKEAVSNFIKATQLDKNYAAAYNGLGIIYEKEQKNSQAEEMYLKAISVDERYYPAYSNLALFNEDRKDFFKALEFWRKRVIYGDPDDPWTKQALQRVKELE